MPYQQVTIHNVNQYILRVQRGGAGATVMVQIEQDTTPEQDCDTAFQEVVDMFDALPGWNILSATKGYVASSNVTPTP